MQTNEILCSLAQQGDTEAQNEIVTNNLGFITAVAGEIFSKKGRAIEATGITFDELIQEGRIALWKAVKKFDPVLGYTFLTYAKPYLKYAMHDLIRERSREVGIQMTRVNLDDMVSEEEQFSYEEITADPYARLPEPILMEAVSVEALHHALHVIDARERTYLLYRFGFEDDEPHTRTDTAAHFHLSESRAKQTEALALDNVFLELPWVYWDGRRGEQERYIPLPAGKASLSEKEKSGG